MPRPSKGRGSLVVAEAGIPPGEWRPIPAAHRLATIPSHIPATFERAERIP